MFEQLHTTINYAKLIELQAQQAAFGPAINRQAELKRSNKKAKVNTKVKTFKKGIRHR